MSAPALELLKTLRRHGVALSLDGDTLRYRAPEGALTPELRADLHRLKSDLKGLLLAMDKPQQVPSDEDGAITAVLLFSSRLDSHCWLVLDETALDEHPDIILSDLPIFFPEELPYLDGKDAAELDAILRTKSVFPTCRVVQ